MSRQPKWLRALGNTKAGVFIVDSAQRIIYWNKGAERALAYTEAEVLNRHCYQVIAGTHCDKAWCHANCLVHRKVLCGALPADFDVLTHTKGGKEIWVNVSIIALPRTGKPLTVHLLRDVTHQKRDQEKLKHIQETLGFSVQQGKVKSQAGAVHSSHPRDALSALSRREVEVLSLFAEGISSEMVARRLNVSPFTVRTHIRNALRKLGLHSKAEAVSFAFRNGLL